jgi:hypothetical protein
VALKAVERCHTNWDAKESTKALRNLSLRNVEAYYLIDQEGSQAPTEFMQISEVRTFAKGKIASSAEIGLENVFYQTHL